MKRKLHFMPKSKLGKWSFWIVVYCFASLYLNYWIAMVLEISIFLPGFFVMGLLVISGITNLISIIKYRDLAMSLFIGSLIGLLGILFVLGEFIFPH